MRILTLAGLAGAFLMAGAAACLADPTPATTGGDTSATTTAATTPPADAAKPKPKDDPNKVICKTIAVTGSRLGGERTCMTRQAWQDQTRASRDTLDETQRNQANPHE